jgi:hypothetical protein
MLDFNHILSTPGYDFQQFIGTASATIGTGSGGQQLQTWRKPRGINWVYIIGVGGGGSGSVGGRAAATAGGGGGGGSGGQTTLLIPASMIPDTLYILAGQGGISGTTVALAGTAGTPTYVLIEPDTTLTVNLTLLLANGGSPGGAEANGGSPGGTGGTSVTIANMPLAGRSAYNFFGGQTGGTGGSRAAGAGAAISIPTTGLMVTGGQGGGGGGNTPNAGNGFLASTGSLGQDFFPNTTGGTQSVSDLPAPAGSPGFISRNFLMNFGGSGGGGSSSITGGIAGAGGDGAPGCGGGGAGASNSNNPTVSPAGNGGPGFVYIISF